jgi:hypothetical protein
MSQERPREMLERSNLRDSIFAAKHRPASVATEFMEDWEVDDDGLDTEIEDDGDNSPRVSLNSVCLLLLVSRSGQSGLLLI